MKRIFCDLPGRTAVYDDVFRMRQRGEWGTLLPRQLVEGTKLSDIVDKIDQEIGIAMAGGYPGDAQRHVRDR